MARYVWLNGEIVPWDEARIHVHTECVMRGANVFEGIRGYWSAQKSELFLLFLDNHIRRLFQSMKLMRMNLPYGPVPVMSACKELIRANDFRADVHLRPTAYFGEGVDYGFEPSEISTGMFITELPRGRLSHVEQGLRCCISTWRRISDLSMPPRLKAGANYHNSRLAYVEARLNGFDNTIMLNDQGKVAESPGACVFLRREETWITPPVTSGILESITREALIRLLKAELKAEVVEREVDRTELYIAEEVFLCGTAIEIAPVVSVDHYSVGDGEPGPGTSSLMELYLQIVRGTRADYHGWLTPTYAPETSRATSE